MQFCKSEQASGGCECAEHHFEAECAHRDRVEMTVVLVKLRDADERCGEGAKRMRERGSLRHRSHRHPETHCESDNGTDREPGENPGVGDDLVMHQRADDGHQHAKLGEMHPALRGFGMAQPLQSEDEED